MTPLPGAVVGGATQRCPMVPFPRYTYAPDGAGAGHLVHFTYKSVEAGIIMDE